MAYILLVLVSLFLLTLAARQNRMLLVAAVGGLGSSMGLADVFIDEVFGRYTFHPHLLVDPVRDDELGFLLADLLFVPLACASLLVLLPRYRTGLVIGMVALLAGVEVLFVRAGLFSYNGWNVGYSIFAFGVRFAIAAWWSSHFERVGYTRWFRLLLVSVTLTYAWWLEAMVSSSLGRLWAARLHLLPKPAADEVLSMFLLVGLPFFLVGLTACFPAGAAPLGARLCWGPGGRATSTACRRRASGRLVLAGLRSTRVPSPLPSSGVAPSSTTGGGCKARLVARWYGAERRRRGRASARIGRWGPAWAAAGARPEVPPGRRGCRHRRAQPASDQIFRSEGLEKRKI